MIHLPFKVGVSKELKIRGIIATKDIKKGGLIESCPLILVDIRKEEEFLKQTVLWKYYYEYNSKYHCIVLGYCSLTNHSYTPNAKYSYDFKNIRLVYRALTDIKSGDEILVNYNFFPNDKKELSPELTDFNKHYKH